MEYDLKFIDKSKYNLGGFCPNNSCNFIINIADELKVKGIAVNDPVARGGPWAIAPHP